MTIICEGESANKGDKEVPVLTPIVAGDRYGRLTFIQEAPRSEAGLRMVRCKCDCGAILALPLKYIRKGNTSSCGCLRREMVAAKNTKHGMRKRAGGSPPEYFIWKQMRNRCNAPGDSHWERYGARGITVCPRWGDFEAFLADMGPRPSPRHSIDRIDNDGPYEPGNCRWATASQQARNKRNSSRVQFQGETYTVADLAEKCGIPYGRLDSRLRKGWSVERAVSEPVVMGKNQHGRP